MRAHRRDIEHYVARRVPAAEVDDLVAEVFAVAWRKRDEVPTQRPLPWLYGVAWRVVQHGWRSGGRWRRLRSKVRSEPSVSAASAAEEWHRSDEHRRAVDAARRLSPDDQEILRLTLWEELSPADAGAVLGISGDAAKKRASRARRRLAEAYDAEGSETEPRPDPGRTIELTRPSSRSEEVPS